MNKLNELISKCKVSVTIYVNEHKEYHESVSEFVENKESELYGADIRSDVLN